VKDALVRIGGLDVHDSPPIVASSLETHYRNRISFALRRLRGGRVVAGFHALERPGRIIDVVSECVLPRRVLLEAWGALRAGWGESAALLPRGERLRLTLRDDPGGVVLVVEGGQLRWSAAPLLEAVPALRAIWHRPGEESGAPHLVAGAEDAGAPVFAQVNAEVSRLLADHVLELAGPAAGRVGPAVGHVTAVDAYAGTGEHARRLAERGWQVTAIEVDPGACRAARAAAGDRWAVLEGRVEDRLEEALPVDLLVVNPPRAGLDAEVVHRILDNPPARVVYVSCDPATLARDVALLGSAYDTSSIRCFDLFPQTAHVETVLSLVRRDGA
jgi:23S rRNA (uracil1939-C5)-methyltransferase